MDKFDFLMYSRKVLGAEFGILKRPPVLVIDGVSE